MAITTIQPSEVVFQEFLTSETWHIPANAIEATVEIIGGGGGGQSGDWRTSTSSSPTPGFGGMGAQGTFMTFPITDRFPASVPVYVGQGGAGGQGSAGSDGVKNNGSDGTASSIGFLYSGRNALQYEVPRIFAMGGAGGGRAVSADQFIHLGPTLENFAYATSQHWRIFPIYQISGSTVNFYNSDGNPLEYTWGGSNPVRLYVFTSSGSGSFGNQTYNITWASSSTGTLASSPGGTVNNVYGMIIPTTQGYAWSAHSDGSSYPGNSSSVGGGGGGSGGYWASSGATYVSAASGGLRYGYEGGTYMPYRHSASGGTVVTGQGTTTIGSAGSGGSSGAPVQGAGGQYGSGGGGGGGSTKSSDGYAGAAGGSGGFPGGGGGGGGVGYTAGNLSGAGGNGANGRVRIWTRTRGR